MGILLDTPSIEYFSEVYLVVSPCQNNPPVVSYLFGDHFLLSQNCWTYGSVNLHFKQIPHRQLLSTKSLRIRLFHIILDLFILTTLIEEIETII